MNKQIMVVDDEAHILLLLDITLKRRGFTVLKANDPYAALIMLDSVTPDLFILDVMMPGMDGLELCRQIRARPETAQTPIMMLSARYDQRSVERGLAAGANTYLSKLSLHADLVPQIRDMLAIGQRYSSPC
jgi:two-component system, OmpR family, phosphate regulon response regulator PhoB